MLWCGSLPCSSSPNNAECVGSDNCQLFRIEGFSQAPHIPKVRWNNGDIIVAGQEQKRYATFMQRRSDREAIIAAEVDIEKCPIQRPVLGHLQPFIDAGDRPDNFAAMALQSIAEQI